MFPNIFPLSSVITPKQIWGANLKQWINFDTASTVVSGNISYADDLSGNSADIEQTTSANRPFENTTGLNNKTTAQFDGISEYMTCIKPKSYFNFLHDGSDGCVIVISKLGDISNPDAGYTIMGDGGAGTAGVGIFMFYDDRSSVPRNEQLLLNVSRGVTGSLAARDEGTSGELSANTWHSIQVNFDANNVTASDRIERFSDGIALTKNNVLTNTQSTADSLNVMHYGCYLFSGSRFSFLKGEIAEIIVLDKHPTSQELANFDNYKFKTWGM